MEIEGGVKIRGGVKIQDVIGPAFGALRPPDKHNEPGAFPVYEDLVDKLLTPSAPVDATRRHPDKIIAHVLAVLAGYAYADAATVAMMMTRLGLENNRCRMINEYVDAMFINSTAFVVQSSDGKVVLVAYRGTKPTDVTSVLTDAEIHPESVGFSVGGGGPYDVHAGYYRNVRSTRFKVAETLQHALDGHSIVDDHDDLPEISPMEVLYLTGHSMGGAMAALMALMLYTDDGYQNRFKDVLQAAYTIGQPMVGEPALARACENFDPFFRRNMIRYINQNDPIPHFPPRDSGSFANFGREYRFSGSDWVHDRMPVSQMSSPLSLFGSMVNFVLRQIPLAGWVPRCLQFEDHFPQHYIAALTPSDVPTEFGDYSYTGGWRGPGRSALGGLIPEAVSAWACRR